MKAKRMLVLSLLVVFAGVVLLSACSQKQEAKSDKGVSEFPSRPIAIVTGGGPGGALDTVTRGIMPYFQKYLGTPVTLENRVGSGHALAMNYVHQSKPDGYTLLMESDTTVILSFELYKEAFAFKDFLESFVPIGSYLNAEGQVLITRKDSPYNSIDDVVKAVKGKEVPIAIAPPLGSGDHLTVLLINKTYGTKLIPVPYPSGAEVLAAVEGGHAELGVVGLSAEGLDPERVKLLVTTLAGPSEFFPGVPSFAELGHPEMRVGCDVGLFAPKGTPEEAIRTLEAALEKAFHDPGFQEWAKKTRKPIGEFHGRKLFTEHLETFKKEVQAVLPMMKEDMERAQRGK